MVTLEQIRELALTLPGVTEGSHFRLPTFKCGGKGFITIQKEAAIIALPRGVCEARQNCEPEKFELAHRNKRFFIGLKANLHPPHVGRYSRSTHIICQAAHSVFAS